MGQKIQGAFARAECPKAFSLEESDHLYGNPEAVVSP
jgi:hypothetical protein